MSPVRIRDKYSREKSPKKRYQYRHLRDGLCYKCPEPRVNRTMCARHAEMHRELVRTLRQKSKVIKKTREMNS